MNLGGFSISLAVKDIAKSKAFYEALGFETFHGVEEQGWLIMKGPNVNIGLFQGMFERNIMTFNPGWDENAAPLADFTDVRELQQAIRANGVEITNPADESGTGPANFMVIDPDGNPILFDQHV